MISFVSAERESYKLQIKDMAAKKHNFRPHKRSIFLRACRGSFAAFQIILVSDTHSCINLDDSPWFSEFSGTENIYFRHEGSLVPTMRHEKVYKGDDGTYYADALLNSPVVDAEEEIPAAVYISFEIPPETVPGKYSGTFKIYTSKLFEKEVISDKITYTVEVLPIEIPAPINRSFDLDLWQHNCNIARKACVSCWSERHFEIIEKYIKALADIGQHTVTAVVTEIPWCGQRCFLNMTTPANLFEYSMISVQQNPDRTYTYDYSVLDRYIELCFRYGINRKIEVFGLINNWVSANDGYPNFTETADAIRIRYRHRDGSYRYMTRAIDIERYIRALCDHFLEKGWIDLVRVVADEPADFDSFDATMRMLQRITPEFRYKAAIISKPFFDRFSDVIEDFCINISGICHAYEEWKELFRNDHTHSFTYYVCCFPEVPNILLASNLLETRYLGILTDFLELKGFLRWNFTVWPKDPIRDIRYSMWPAGDTNFVYPSGDMTPALTLRYMALRRGIEDYELLQQLRQKGRTDVVEQIHDMIISNRNFDSFYSEITSLVSFGDISTDHPEDYDRCRNLIYAALTE